MVKLVLLFRRRSDLSPEQFLRYWRQEHVPLVLRVPGILRYVISPVQGALGRGGTAVDGMAELWFADEAAMKVALASDETRATAEDAERFIEVGSISRFWCHEELFVEADELT